MRATRSGSRGSRLRRKHSEPDCVGEPTAPLGVEVLRLKKARRWLWALATTKDYEHAPIESLVSVMHATRVRCVVELVLTPAPVLLDRYAGRALARS